MASYLFFAVKNIISRGYGGCSTIFGISRGEGWGVRRGGGVLYDIPSVVGVWIFSGTTHCMITLKECFYVFISASVFIN